MTETEATTTPDGRPRRKHTAVLRAWLSLPGLRVADVGCGSGGLARVLAGKGAWALGLDPQAAALQRAVAADAGERQEAAGDARPAYVAAAGEALPLAAGCLDAVIYFNALHHVPVDRQDAALADAARVLAPGGRLVVVEPLAEGPAFALMRPVEDETAVRAAAQAALARAAEAPAWRLAAVEEYTAAVRHSGFEAFRDGLLAVDPGRAAALAAREAEMRAAFYNSARPAEDGYWLDQPYRLHVLDRRDD